ncbi:MAG: DUF5011 domain-containing protein [Bacteroidetes bacterium]|nr:DUF5011 domain-containing protein [Bacteroidota bacterium]
MKKALFIVGLLATTFLFITGCSKDDTEAPVISLTAPINVTLNIGEAFVDPGYSASDNEDGDITSRVSVDLSDLDENTAGEYVVTYSVTDDAGNSASESRNVTVQNSLTPNNIAGTWNVSEVCGGGPSTYIDTISYSDVQNGRVLFTRFANYLNGAVYADINISGGTVNIPTQNVVCGQAPAANRQFSGNGTYSNVGGVFSMSITYTEVTNGTSVTCTGAYTK